jgi:hypothetical protein
MNNDTTADRPDRPRWHRILSYAFGNWAARIYLIAVLAAVGIMIWDLATHRVGDPAFSPVHLLVLTGPVSWLASQFVDSGGSVAVVTLLAACAVGALINATLVGAAADLIKRYGRSVCACHGCEVARSGLTR